MTPILTSCNTGTRWSPTERTTTFHTLVDGLRQRRITAKCPTYHATVEVLVHLTEGVRRRLPLAGDDDADVRHRQGVLRLDGLRSAERDEDALRDGGAVVDVGAAAVRRGLDDLAALNQTLLAVVQHAVTEGGHINRQIAHYSPVFKVKIKLKTKENNREISFGK